MFHKFLNIQLSFELKQTGRVEGLQWKKMLGWKENYMNRV